MEPPSKVIEFLPSPQAKWALWLSLSLSGLLYVLLEWLQVDKLLPLGVAQKLSILLPSAALLLIGAIFILYFVIGSYNKQASELAKIKQAIKDYIQLRFATLIVISTLCVSSSILCLLFTRPLTP